MYAQVAIKPNPLLRNGAYGIVMRGVQKCTRGCSSLRGRNKLPLCCIKLDTATDSVCVPGGLLHRMAGRCTVRRLWQHEPPVHLHGYLRQRDLHHDLRREHQGQMERKGLQVLPAG